MGPQSYGMSCCATVPQELYEYLRSFKGEEENHDGAHPASLVLECLGDEDVVLRCATLQAWYQDYAQLRGMPYLFKPPGQDPCWQIMVLFFLLWGLGFGPTGWSTLLLQSSWQKNRTWIHRCLVKQWKSRSCAWSICDVKSNISFLMMPFPKI